MTRFTYDEEWTDRGGTYFAVYDNLNQRREIARTDDRADAEMIAVALNEREARK